MADMEDCEYREHGLLVATVKMQVYYYSHHYKLKKLDEFYRLVTNILHSHAPIFAEKFAGACLSACPIEMAGMGDCD